MDNPIDRIEWRDAATLKANAWNPNYVLTPELRLLERSLLKTGWVQPVLINPEGIIIDGFHRWRLSLDSPAVKARFGGKLPCAILCVTEAEAMLLTVRMNRAKGSHSALRMGDLVKRLLTEFGYDRAEIAVEIGASKEEVDLLAQESVFTQRNIDSYRYSRAWVPAYQDKRK